MSYKPGTITSIKLVNFMCHDSFELTLGPRVNFIIGPNGSGKSALLTALVVALGGRATTTSRAKRTNEFVMYGKSQARISVRIHNYEKIMDKTRAFKPDDYGKFITVEKIIYQDHVSKLVLKNDKDKKVSERKAELDEMLEHFGILINNPICILNQEISKTFLHSKRPEDKFALFMKATNLEQIEQDYDVARATHKEWDDSNAGKTVAFKMMDAEYNSCKEKTGFLENRSKLNDTKEALNRELIWAIVKESEAVSDELTKKVQEIDATIAGAEKIIEDRHSKITNCEEEIKLMKTKIQAIYKQMEFAREKLSKANAEETSKKTKKIEIKQKIESTKRNISRIKMDNISLAKSIADMKRQFQDQNALDHDNEQRKLDIDRLERELPADQAKERSIRLHTDQLSTSMTAIRAELHSANARTGDIKSKISQNQAILRRLKNGQENVLRKYGDFVVKIVDEIERAHNAGRFKKKPIGPLGYHLKLKSPEIASSLECHLGRNAHAFICDNHQDMTTLNTLFKRLSTNSRDFKQPVVITRPFGGRHNISRFKSVHDRYKTMLDYLEIEEDVVYNAVVDRTFLESVLFIPNYSDAEHLMLQPDLVPKFTRCAYTKDCSVMYPRTASGGYKSFSNDPSRFILFSEGNLTQIKQVEREIEMLNADLRDAEKIVTGIQSQLNAQRVEYDSNTKETKRLIDEIRKKEEQLLNLRTIIAVEPQELSALETEHDNNLSKIATENLAIEKHNETLAALDQDLEDVKKRKEEASKLHKVYEDERQSIHKMIEGTKNTILESTTMIRQQEFIIENRKILKEQQSKKLEDAIEKLARSKQGVRGETAGRPANIRNPDEIRKDLQKIDAQIRLDEEEQRDPEELLASIKKRMEEIDNLKSLKNSNLQNCSATLMTLDERREGLNALRSITISGVAATFSAMMRSMNMNGRLQIHVEDQVERGVLVRKARTLDMQIDTSWTPSQRVGSVMNDNNNNNTSHGGVGGDDPAASGRRRVSRSQPVPSTRRVPPAPVAPSRPKRARTDRTSRRRTNNEGDEENNDEQDDQDDDNNNHDDVDVVNGSQAAGNEKENEIKMTDARSLSGGERSFSTVAFVLALWHHCSSPFKLMDEIDVFMDMVTRRLSYNALIRYAQIHQESGQFIFFSPLELPKFDDMGNLVRVFEMPAIIRKRPHSQVDAAV